MQAQIGVKFKNMNYLVRIQFPNAPLQECCQIVARSIADGWDLDLSLLVLSWTCAHCIYFYAVLHCLCALWSPAECITFCGTQQNLHTTLHLLQLYKRRKKMVNNERNSKKKKQQQQHTTICYHYYYQWLCCWCGKLCCICMEWLHCLILGN